MARTKVDEIGTDETKRKNHAVSASISPELYDSLEEYRWANRMKASEVLIAALNAYLGKTEDQTVSNV